MTNLCRNVSPNLGDKLKGELQHYLDPVVSSLMEKLGDNLLKVRTSAEDALLSLAQHPCFGVQLVLNVMLRNP